MNGRRASDAAMCGTALSSKDLGASSLGSAASSKCALTNPNVTGQRVHYPARPSVIVTPRRIPSGETSITVLPFVAPRSAGPVDNRVVNASHTGRHFDSISREINASCVRGRRTVRRELERQRRSLHAAGVEDLRRMLLPSKSGPVSITQVLQEAVRVVRMEKAEERGALHAKEFLKEKRSYLRARLAKIKCGVQPINDDRIIAEFVTKVRNEKRSFEQNSL